MSRGGATVSERVVRAVANRVDADAAELPTLYDAVDPDALDTLVEGMSVGSVSFAYGDHQVIVDSDGEISVDDRPGGHPSAGLAASDH